MIKLYFAPRTRSTRPRWVLEELGVPYELVRLDLSKGEHKAPEYLAVHPLGLVPALVDGDVKVIESAAICAYLADRFPEHGLAPAPSSPDRGAYLQWLFFAVATVEPTLPRYQAAALGTGPERSDEAAVAARASFDQAAAVLEKALSGHDFIAGASFTAADVVLGSMLAWARSMKLLDTHPALAAYVKRLTERPAFRRAQGS